MNHLRAISRYRFGSAPQDNLQDQIYIQGPKYALAGFTTLAFGAAFYFYLNKEKIAQQRVEEFESRTGLKYGDVKVDQPLAEEYRQEYVDKQKRVFKQKIDAKKQAEANVK